MSKFVRIVGVGAAAAAAMYLLDPDRGRSRRAKLSDQAAALARKAEEKTRAQAEYQKGVVQGLAHDLTEPFRPEPEFDDETLRQKVKSEAIGRWDGPKNDVEVDVDNGVVTLKGNDRRPERGSVDPIGQGRPRCGLDQRSVERPAAELAGQVAGGPSGGPPALGPEIEGSIRALRSWALSHPARTR